eukprot:234027-Prymnesium_polylepis.1
MKPVGARCWCTIYREREDRAPQGVSVNERSHGHMKPTRSRGQMKPIVTWTDYTDKSGGQMKPIGHVDR